MAIYQFQVSIPMTSGLPKDVVTNTWHFSDPVAPIITDFDNVRDMLKDFYTTAPTGGGSALKTYYPTTVGSTATVKAYNLSDPIPRAPVYSSTFAFSGTGTTAMPSEVAIVMSFQAAKVSGELQSRRRNRVYLGPLATSANLSTGRPDSAFTTQVQRAGATLLAAAQASATWQWVIWSPTDQESHDVADGWVDNAWDTQRRRGLAATSRTTF